MAIPKRRWFRFSLRTMFVAHTVVAVWLGWNGHVVQQRREMRKTLAESPYFGGYVSERLAAPTAKHLVPNA